MKSNLIEEKSYANWCRRYWKSTPHFIVYDYVVEKKKVLKKQRYGKKLLYSILNRFYIGHNLFFQDETY